MQVGVLCSPIPMFMCLIISTIKCFKATIELGRGYMPVIPVLKRLMQEDLKFKTSLRHTIEQSQKEEARRETLYLLNYQRINLKKNFKEKIEMKLRDED